MKVCFHSIGLHRDPVALMIEKVSAAGYAGLELGAETIPWAEPAVTPDLDQAGRSAIVRAAAARGIEIAAVAAHIPMLYEDAGRRAEAIA